MLMKNMLRNTFAAAVLALLMIGTEACSSSKQTRSASGVGSSNAIQLFNGKNLDGWYSFIKDRGRDADVKKVFTVSDGLIHISGEEYGSIVTEKEYDNYKLVVEFKWGTKTYEPRIDRARDNGVLIHSTGVDGGYAGTWMHSIECQIIEVGTGDFLVVGDGSDRFALTSPISPDTSKGKFYKAGGTPYTIHKGRINWYGRDPLWKDKLDYRGPHDVENKVGEWNKLECIAEGDKVTVFLNNVLVNEAWNVKPSRGKIQIQSEGAEMFVRSVELIPLAVAAGNAKDDEGFTKLFNGKDINNWVGSKSEYIVENETISFIPKPGNRYGGNLFTDKEYGDFNLRFDFKLTDSANSGLAIRSPLSGETAFDGIELQIIDNESEKYRNIKPWQYHGSVYGVIPAKRGYLKPVGEWNHQEVIVRGSKVKVILNGETILDGDIADAGKNGTLDGKDHPGLKREKGHIGFLGHGSIVWFKNIRIKELSKVE